MIIPLDPGNGPCRTVYSEQAQRGQIHVFPLLQIRKWSQQWGKGLSLFVSSMMFRYRPQVWETLRNYSNGNTIRNKLPGRRKTQDIIWWGGHSQSMLSPFMKLNIAVYMMENLCWFILIKAPASSSEKLYRDLGENSTGGISCWGLEVGIEYFPFIEVCFVNWCLKKPHLFHSWS